jgi:hypothetical protein
LPSAAISHLLLEGLHRRTPSAELLRLAAGVLERRARVGLDVITGLDPLEAVPFE